MPMPLCPPPPPEGSGEREASATRHRSSSQQRERVSCFLCQAKASNLGCEGRSARLFSFCLLAKISGRHASLDRISCGVFVVCGSLMWRRQHESRKR